MDRMVDRPAVQNFGTAAHPLELEAESLGDRTAAIVVGGDVNLGPMDSQLEEMIDDCGRGPGDETSALVLPRDPVADLGPKVGSMKPVQADHAHDRGSIIDRRDDRPVPAAGTVASFHRVFDEGQAVCGGPSAFDPGQPGAKSGSILINQSEEHLGMARFHRLESKVGSRLEGSYDVFPEHAFDYTF